MIISTLLAQIIFAQKQTTHLQQIWTVYFNQYSIWVYEPFQQLFAGNLYKEIQAIRVFYFHNLDLRKNHIK